MTGREDPLDNARRMYQRVLRGWALDCLALRKQAATPVRWGVVRVAGVDVRRLAGGDRPAARAGGGSPQTQGGARWAA